MSIPLERQCTMSDGDIELELDSIEERCSQDTSFSISQPTLRIRKVGGSLYAPFLCAGKRAYGLMDSGANVTILSERLFAKVQSLEGVFSWDCGMKATVANDSSSLILSKRVVLFFTLGSRRFPFEAYVSSDISEDMIVGTDMMEAQGICLDPRDRQVNFKDTGEIIHCAKSLGDGVVSCQAVLRATGSTLLPPGKTVFVCAAVRGSTRLEWNSPGTVITGETAPLRPLYTMGSPCSPIHAHSGRYELSNGATKLAVTNLSTQPVSIHPGTELALFELSQEV